MSRHRASDPHVYHCSYPEADEVDAALDRDLGLVEIEGLFTAAPLPALWRAGA